MGSDSPMVIQLEITVPHIVLPINAEPENPSSIAAPDNPSADEQAEEHIRILGLQPLSASQPRVTATSRMAHTLHFHLFQSTLPALVMHSRAIVLQLLRRRNWLPTSKGNQQVTRNNEEHLYISDALMFSLELRQTARNDPAETLSPPTPGVNQVVIYVDNEGIPVSYSIDGAES